jgi:hypothetical protein
MIILVPDWATLTSTIIQPPICSSFSDTSPGLGAQSPYDVHRPVAAVLHIVCQSEKCVRCSAENICPELTDEKKLLDSLRCMVNIPLACGKKRLQLCFDFANETGLIY